MQDWIEYLLRSDNLSPTMKFGFNQIREISYGTNRVCFEILSGPEKGNVIKFARDEMYVTNNRAEVATWKMAEKRGKERYFCPITRLDDESYRWLIMEKADTPVKPDVKSEFQEEIKDEFPEQFIDIHCGNLGIHNGKTKLIDYAWF